jgi:hypothetical protein
MAQVDRIVEFLQRLSPVTRSCLLIELERLEASGVDLPGFSEIQSRLRSEFRKDGSTQTRSQSPSRYFFGPVEMLLSDGAPEHANTGRIPRISLSPIWEWICRDLLRTMARDFIAQMVELISADKQKEALQVAAVFQIKVVKYLESTLRASDAADQARARLATYTASPFVYEDLVKIMCAMRAADALAKFDKSLPKKIVQFDDAAAGKITQLLDAFAKQHADAVPFAITLVANRLRTPWQMMRVATNNAASKKAVDVAAMPYAVAISMVLDRLEDHRSALRIALKHNRVLVAKELLTDIYDTEFALRVRIDRLNQSEWGVRLRRLMDSIAALVEAEIKRFPDKVGHVLGSRRLRSSQSLSGRLTYLSWKARDALTDGAAFCKKLITAA